MAPNPGATAKRINDTIAAWEEHAPETTFSGLTLAQYKTRVKPSLDARATTSELRFSSMARGSRAIWRTWMAARLL